MTQKQAIAAALSSVYKPRFNAIVGDERDVNSPEPYSTLGTFATRDLAQEAIDGYLMTENGPFVTDSFVEEV